MTELHLTPAELDHRVQGGDGYGFVVDTLQDGVPLDVSAYVIATAIIGPSQAGPTAWNVTREAGSTSRVRYWLSSAETRALAPVSRHEIQMTPPGGEPRTYIRGTIRKTAEIVV